MSRYPIKRTPEQGHSKECLATAMVVCLTGWITATDVTDFEFRLYAQDNGALTEADDLLRDGNTPCLCEPLPLKCEWLNEYPAGPHPGCSEFDGGATFQIPCGSTEGTATYVVVNLEPYCKEDEEPEALRLCAEHVAEVRRGPFTATADDTVVPMEVPC